MELEVRLVAGLLNCFVSLPSSLIQILQSKSPPIHGIRILQLTDANNQHQRPWLVSWSGATSSHSIIQIDQQFADCIGLMDRTIVRLQFVDLPMATQISIEPLTSDDWEVIELNSELAESNILNQVRIVHESMTFPLWLHGRSAVKFKVVSTTPKTAAVLLMQNTEVIVAPKSRENNVNNPTQYSNTARALLRVQDADQRLVHKTVVKGVELGVVLSSFGFIHPETAKDFSLDALQLVTIAPSVDVKDPEISSSAKEVDAETLSEKKTSRQAVIHLLISDTVAKGHIMIAQSLRLYLNTGLHSWVHIRGRDIYLNKEIPGLSLQRCQFKMYGTDKSSEDNLEVHSRKKSFITKFEVFDESAHNEAIETLSRDSPRKENEHEGLNCLIRSWFLAQLAVTEKNTIVLGSKTLLHFEVSNAREIFYVLKIPEKSSSGRVNVYELSSDENCGNYYFETIIQNLKLGEPQPVSFYSIKERTHIEDFSSDISSFSWMESITSDVINRMIALLSPTCGMSNAPLRGHVLIHGPPGCGKTFLAKALAKFIEEHEDILAHIVFVACSELAGKKPSTILQEIYKFLTEALDHAPSLVIFDDLDSIISSSSNSGNPQISSTVDALTQFFADIMDEYADKRKSICGIGPIAFMASSQSLESIPQSVCSSGRFDFHVQLSAPAAPQRGAILKYEIQKRSLGCADDIVLDIASKCDGYDAYDLEILVDRAAHAASGRLLPSLPRTQSLVKPSLVRDDFTRAMDGFVPVAMRDVTKSAPEDGRSGWEDVGGLVDVRNKITEIIELPAKFPEVFSHAPLRLQTNMLLYGPPGCGKTHIVGAAAAALSIRFISVKGPELLNKYIGASEQAVRDLFSKAGAAAPCLLFFDEFDSIAPKRGHDNTGVTDRVVNQFLTELDGVEALTGVFVFAATSRPDLLDDALLRPGRLDRLIFCDFPSPHERLDILTVLSKKLPLAEDVDLDVVACMTEGLSGADLQALLSDAQLEAVHEVLNAGHNSALHNKPVITDSILKSVATKARASVSEAEKQRLYNIYSNFLGSRKPDAKSRESKGKRATLA
ncbi:hypothetical protein ACFE04_013839 [Oxalis oulophora]